MQKGGKNGPEGGKHIITRGERRPNDPLASTYGGREGPRAGRPRPKKKKRKKKEQQTLAVCKEGANVRTSCRLDPVRRGREGGGIRTWSRHDAVADGKGEHLLS